VQTDTNDTKMETTAETVETVAEDPNALVPRINTSYNPLTVRITITCGKERFLNPTLSASSFAFNELSAIHTVVHTVKPIPRAVCDEIQRSLHSRSELAIR
jgi:hypothetical protein